MHETAPGSSNKSTLIRTQILQGDLIQQRMKSKGKNEYNEYNEYDNIYWNRTVPAPLDGNGSSVVQDQAPFRTDMNKQNL